MKRIYYLLAFIAVATAFTACNPLDKTYKDLGNIPKPTAPPAAPIVVTTTLTAADYGLLPSTNYAKTAQGFNNINDAKTGVSVILGAKYPTAVNKSSALVTFGITNPVFKPADSLYSHVYYAVINPDDYVAAQGTTGTTFKDYSDAQVLLFLKYKYPTPSDNQLVVLNYIYYSSGLTPSSGVNTTDSFIYLNGSWMKIYTITNAQYGSVGHGIYNQFVTADNPATINGYFNTFLKNDATVAATVKYGDTKYISYNYYISSGTAKGTYQRVQVLTFDGTNWVTTPIASTPLSFLKTDGVWVADNTVSYTLVANDYKYMGNNTTAGSAAGRANIVSYPDFNVSATTDATYWSDTDIQGALITFLVHAYPAAAVNQKFNITYLQYFKGATSNVTKVFQYDGTTFVFVP